MIHVLHLADTHETVWIPDGRIALVQRSKVGGGSVLHVDGYGFPLCVIEEPDEVLGIIR